MNIDGFQIFYKNEMKLRNNSYIEPIEQNLSSQKKL
jgi:hypothetical protein